MATPFIPRKDSLALPMMRAFAGGIAPAPGAYALSPADAAAIGRAVDEFDAALAVATRPQSRTASAVLANVWNSNQ